jgi:hypothetical protein
MENYPEDKLTELVQDLILEELGRVFHGTLKEELPHLRSFSLEGGIVMYVCVCADQTVWSMAHRDRKQSQAGITG